MKKNKIIKKFAKLSVYTLLVALGTGCTDKFEEYNTNPFGPKPDQMLGDNAITGSLIKSMIPALVQGQQNNSQMLDQMDIFGKTPLMEVWLLKIRNTARLALFFLNIIWDGMVVLLGRDGILDLHSPGVLED